MKLLIIMLLFCPMLVLSQDYIVYEDGRIYNVPDNKRVVVVDKDTPRHVWTLGNKVKLRTPKGRPEPEPECDDSALVISPSTGCPETLSLGN